MVVQHNMTAMNSNRMLAISQGTLSKSAEKLSSGYKVNRAADDAAGLSISEKMRKQMRGLTQASLNAEDGISAVQTAEGALTEVHDMLQRMNELAVKSANGTMSEDDRQTLQDEVDQLLTEIDRVAETTKFNETYLLKGDPRGYKVAVTLNAHDAGLKGHWEAQDSAGAWKVTTTAQNTSSIASVRFVADELNKDDKVTIGGVEYTIANTTDEENYKLTAAAAYDRMAIELMRANSIGLTTDSQDNVLGFTKRDGTTVNAADLQPTVNHTGRTFTITKGKSVQVQDLAMSLHVGADADMTNKITVNIQDLSTTGLGIKNLTIMKAASPNTDDDTITDRSDNSRFAGANATYAIDAIADAVAKVSAQRSKLGAIQNRLEHTIKNLDNVVENTTAAESQIRDTDMATEMVKYSNNNILAQAGQSMLAQANQANQGVLSLIG